MRILYITNGIIGAGGLERVLAIKASLLTEQFEYEVHILTLNQNDEQLFYDFSSKIIMHNIKVGGNPLEYIRQYYKEMRSVVQKIRPDVISVCDDGFKGFFLPIILRKPCSMIYERHVSKEVAIGQNPTFISRLFTDIKFYMMNALAKTYDRFVVLTKDNVNEWQLSNIEVISNPLSFYPVESARLDSKKVIAVGRQSHQKGYDLLLQSWVIVNSKHPDWTLDVYGLSDPMQNLPAMAVELNLGNVVTFHEAVRNIQEKYLDASIYVMSSRYEGFGMVLIEAMACGVPCVSFDCPCGPADIISDREDGLLASNGDIDNLAACIEKLIEDNELRKKMGKEAKINVRRFLPETIVNEWDLLFKTLTRNANAKLTPKRKTWSQ